MKNRAIFLPVMAACLVGCIFTGCQKTPDTPHIILVYVDDMGVGDLSFTSGEVRPTPNIDRIAREGKVFQNYYTNSPVCSPSRVAVTTGMYPLRWNINTFLSSKNHNDICDQSGFLDSKAPSLARVLKSAGYRTAHFGKWHMGGGRNIDAPPITNYGFDDYASTWESPDPDPLLTSTDWIWAPSDSIKRWERTAYFVEKTLDFLERNTGTPCFINLWPDDVHSPWIASADFQQGDRKEYYALDNLEPVITQFDRDMGGLITGIEALELADETLIIFTSDNGPAPTFGSKRTNQLRGCKNSLFEGGIKMPFIAYWPSVIKGGQVDQSSVISAVDLYPTICRIASARIPEYWEFDGEDFSRALLKAKTFSRKTDLFWEYGRMNPKYSIPKDSLNISLPLAIRSGDWKFFCSFDGECTELYDLESDPLESENVSPTHPEIVEDLKERALTWFETNDKKEIINLDCGPEQQQVCGKYPGDILFRQWFSHR